MQKTVAAAIVAFAALALGAEPAQASGSGSRVACSSPTPHNTRLAVMGDLSGPRCTVAKQVARAADEQYALDDPTRDLGVTYSIDPYTAGQRIWSCEMVESRRRDSMVLHVDCLRGGRAVLMTWVWPGVWAD